MAWQIFLVLLVSVSAFDQYTLNNLQQSGQETYYGQRQVETEQQRMQNQLLEQQRKDEATSQRDLEIYQEELQRQAPQQQQPQQFEQQEQLRQQQQLYQQQQSANQLLLKKNSAARAPSRPRSQNSLSPQVSEPLATNPGTPSVVRPAKGSKRSTESNLHERFNTKLFYIIGPSNPHRNVVYSPLSLQTLLSFVYIGAEKETAKELQQALELPASKERVTQIFQKLMRSEMIPAETKLIMANQLYHRSDISISQRMRDVVAPQFDAEMTPIDFRYPTNAADIINYWVALKTQNRITNLVTPDMLDPQTSAILVNAIYFKAKWQKEMSTLDTLKNNFYTSDKRTVPVDMMFIDSTFRYANLPSIRAQVIELQYKDSDMSMMVILPHSPDGLYGLELDLKNIDLNSLADTLQTTLVEVRLPKFTIEFDLDLLEPLTRLGVSRLFSNEAQLGGIFQREVPVGISKVKQKAYLEVNEAGSEATAATFSKLIPLSLPPESVSFNANHPFMFAIRSPKAVYFVGHVVDF